MASGGGFSYKPNVNRNVTRKWRDAARPTYDDDEWGDDGYGAYDEPPPVPGPAQRPQMPHPSRSFTNPSPPRSTGRASFDRGDDRRYVSAGSGFASAYPSTQQAPFPEPQHDEASGQRFYSQHHPALQVNTQGQGPYPPPGFRPGSRGQHSNDVPFSAPGAYQRSHSGNRSSPGGFGQPQRQASPGRPDSRSSNTSSMFRPPRKSSLSQEQPPPPPIRSPVAEIEDKPTSPSAPAKPLPFIRPADIYKRFEEEKERERRSSETQRPSLELDTTKSRDSAVGAKTAAPDRKDAPVEDSDSTRRLRPALDTVEERKSEYGFDNMLKSADQSHPSFQGEGVQRNATNASSVYTDRPDPVSASTADDERDDAEPSSAFSYQSSLPPLGRISVFDPQLTPSQTHAEPVPAIPAGVAAAGSEVSDAKAEGSRSLNHQPSLGYTSVVQQAFDDSQNQQPSSPTSNTDTLPRSNSASTSELSPIMTRRPDLAAGPSGPPVTDQPIPEEPSSSTSNRPLSDSTIKAEPDSTAGDDVPSPPVIQHGYRRDVTPPNREANSPARQADIRKSTDIQHQRGIVAALADDTSNAARPEHGERGRSREPSDQVISPSASQASGVSEEYNQWQAHSKQFNTKLGFGSNPTTPSVNSPITRAESPSKGTVRDLAGKYESNSGRSTPVNTAAGDLDRPDTTRPAPQERLDSFRPVLPGGWQSFAGTPDTQTPQHEQPQKPPLLGQRGPQDSTDSIPTATAPKSWQQGPSNAAFAAAAAAGTALAGSFNGPALTDRKTETSDDESENEWDQSSVSSRAEPVGSATRDFATPRQAVASPAGGDGIAMHSQGITPSDDLGKDTPSDTEQSRSDYFPAPLRTSKSIEPGTVPRPPIPSVQPAQDSPVHENDEKLQEDIVKSLTPRSSNFEAQPREEAVSKALPLSPMTNDKPASTLTANESDDMYGGASGQRTPAQGPGPQLGFVAGHQPQYSVSSMGSAIHRPMLEQRFSWEMEKEDQKTPRASTNDGAIAASSTPTKVTSPLTASPATVRAVPEDNNEESNMTALPTNEPTVTGSHSLPEELYITLESDAAAAPGASQSAAGSMAPAMASSPTEAKSFRAIMNIGNQHDRIKAFEDNRATYGQSDGGLDQWIQSMQQVPEHANIFQSNGRIWKDTGNNYNTAKLPSNRPMASITGSKIVQEDGKRLMAAAGRFGGKAGIAAKGLFAKGKDKLRSTSTSDKIPQSKRKSEEHSSAIVQESNSKRDSAFLVAPQIPEQEPVTPMDENNWFSAARDSSAPSDTKVDNIPGTDRSESGERAVLGQSTTRDESGNVANPGQADQHESHMSAAGSTAAATVVPAVQIRTDSGRALKDEDQDTTPTAADQAATAGVSSTPGHERKVSDLTDEDVGQVRDNQLQATQSLTAPDDRRLSAVSAVSSASPSPVDALQREESQRRVSPAEPTPDSQPERRASESVPSYDETVPAAAVAASATKEEEAAQDRAAVDSQNDPVPSYEETPGQGARPQRIGPDAQILPVADLTQQRRNEPVAVHSRPFSFEATESFSQAQQAYAQDQQNQNAPSQPLSPVSQTASKDLSQVSVEEVTDDAQPRPGRQSKSYSRPFGADPVGDHPAFRQTDQPINRSQMYSTEAPPANARHVPQTRPAEEAGYRIPGPYGQEYRSPKPRQQSGLSPSNAFARQPSFPDQGSAGYGDPPQFSNAPPPQQHQQHHQQPRPDQWQQSQQQMPPPRQDYLGAPPHSAEPPKAKRTFGAFLRGKSKAQPAPMMQPSGRQQKSFSGPAARPALATRGSRQDSVTSGQSSLGESRDVIGQLPPAEKSRNRLSRDPSKFGGSSGRNSAEPPVDGKKKKRFSAMGNLFGRSDKAEKAHTPQRSTTLPSGTAQPDRGQYQQYHQQDRMQDPMYQPYYGAGSPPPAEGYYGGTQARDYLGHGQYSQSQQGYQVASPQGYESRPSDLRIDTSGQGRSVGQPATAPVQSYSRSNNAPQNGAVPHGSYSATTHSNSGFKGPPSTRAPLSQNSSIDPHVASLHKRSRSPTSAAAASASGRVLESPEPGYGGANRNSDTLAPPDRSGRNSGGTPVDGLGTFSKHRISPVDGIPRRDEEQEAPFRIGIPGSENEESRRRTRQILIEQGRFADAANFDRGGEGAAKAQVQPRRQSGEGVDHSQRPSMTVAERMMNPGREDRGVNAASATRAPLSRSSTRDQADGDAAGGGGEGGSGIGSSKPAPTQAQPQGFVAELPGSKADGYESEEEVKMSATVKPGDWEMPVFV